MSRTNSLSSYHSCVSRQNSINLSRQNSFSSHRTVSPQNSLGSGAPPDEYKRNNLSAVTVVKALSEEEENHEEEQEDVDAADETVSILVPIYPMFCPN